MLRAALLVKDSVRTTIEVREVINHFERERETEREKTTVPNHRGGTRAADGGE